jgi:MFS family permease
MPLIAGLLAAWWRGAHQGENAGRHARRSDSNARRPWPDFSARCPEIFVDQFGGAEGMMEIPGWLAAASLIGAVLGFIGAAGGAAFGGRIPPAERGRTAALPGRVLLIASALALGVAAAIAVAVIPAFAADTSPGATPDRAVPGLGIMAVLNVYAGVAFLVAKSAKSGRANRAIAATTGLLAIAMGATMAAAASAAVDHLHIGLGAVALVVTAIGDAASGILALVVVFRSPERIEWPWPIPGGPEEVAMSERSTTVARPSVHMLV